MDEDERELFRRSLGRVRPLAQNRSARRAPPPPPRPLQKERDERAAAEALGAVDPADAEAASGDAVSFSVPGVQRGVLRRLRRGEYRVEGELDLHGQTAGQAQGRLREFLRGARRRGWRCVRIVHGKGLGSAGGRPVLKGRVDLWLRRSAGVLAFCSAPPHDGGTGAVYVLLRRD